MRAKLDPQISLVFSEPTTKTTREYHERYERVSEVLDATPEILTVLHEDLKRPLKYASSADKGGRSGRFTTDNVLRILLVMIIESMTLRRVVVLIDDSEFLVGPVVKKYLRPRGAVAPFLRTSAAVGWTNNTTRQTNAVRVFDTFIFSARAGIGADWFPLEGISLGGFTGILLNRAKATNTLNDVGLTQDTWAVTTFRSNLVLRIWF